MSIINDIRAFLATGLGKVLTASAVLAALVVLAICKLLVGVVGLPLGLAGLIVFGSFVAFLATAVCIGLKRAGVWTSGGTVGSVIFVIWLLGFLMWEGTRIYLYAADLYQWGALAKWGWFTVSWVGVAAAAGIFVTLVYKGPKVVIWAFTILSVLVTGTAIIDASQFGPAYRSPFSGELMVKASVLPDGSTYPIPMGAEFDRMHPWVTEFRKLDLSKPEDQAILENWYRYGVSQGVSDEQIEARKECAAKKAAAKTAGRAEPKCSVNGAPQDVARSAFESIAAATGMASDFAGLEPAEFPLKVSLDQDAEMKFRADPIGDKAEYGALQLVVCDGVQVDNLSVAVNAIKVHQTTAKLGKPVAIVFDPGVKSGEQVITVRQLGRGHIEAVIGRGSVDLVGACPAKTTGGLLQHIQNMKEQGTAAP